MRLRWRTRTQIESELKDAPEVVLGDPSLAGEDCIAPAPLPGRLSRSDHGPPDPLSYAAFRQGRSGPSIRLDQKF
jgi:hypothetical protein